MIYKKIVSYISGKDLSLRRSLVVNKRWKKEVIVDVLFEVAATLNGDEEFERLHNVSDRIGLTEDLIAKMKNIKKSFIVAEATRNAGKLKLKSLVLLFKENLYSTDYDTWNSAARALVNTGCHQILIDFLIEKEHVLKEWSIIRITDMLKNISDEDIVYMYDKIDEVSPLLKGLFIEIIGLKRGTFALFKIESFLFSEQKELRLKSLKALADIGMTTKQKLILQFLNSDDWVLKIHALQVVKSCKLFLAVPDITQLLSDSNWWVRFRAAEVLCELGEAGELALTKIRNKSADPFARDMANLMRIRI